MAMLSSDGWRTLLRGGAILGAGALINMGVRPLLSQIYTPYLPDIALQAGMELTSRRRRVLAFGPHPTDLEFFVGGTLFLLTQNRSDVTMAVLSRGEGAGTLASMGQIRAREQEASAAVLGAKLRQFELPDGKLSSSDGLMGILEELWRRVNPEVLFAFDPKGPLPGSNPDHAALGLAVMELCRKGIAENTRVYFYAGRQPNVLVDVTEVVQEKESAVKCHRSQLKGPDAAVKRFVRSTSRLSRGRTPAMYTEALHRII